MNKTVRHIDQRHLIGLSKLGAFAYLITYLWIHFTIELLRFRLGFVRYYRLLCRLLVLLGKLTHNKVIRINGTYKFQIYLPAFPTPAFFHALRKYDPATRDPGPITVVLSMTKACGYKCPHCYQRLDQGQEIEMGLLKNVVRQMQDVGVCTFDIEGGEPLLRFERLCDLLSAFDQRTEIWVNTTGHQLTRDKAKRLRELGVFGVYVSIHSADAATYDVFTGMPGSLARACDAIRLFHEVGIATAINYCASPTDVEDGGVERIFDLGRELAVAFVQVIHGKPAGAWLQNSDEMIHAPTQIEKLRQLHRKYNTERTCRDHPCAAVQVFEEQAGVFGCTAGGVDRFYLNHAGEVQPCEFLNVSFGNVTTEPFPEIFARMRSHFTVPGQHWLCCTEAASIARAIENQGHQQTPLLQRHTETLLADWDKGPATPLYVKLGIYSSNQAAEGQPLGAPRTSSK
jgi:MoaA/NifB/PqqE/SkfB family radical SAM enzyme